MTGSNRGAGSGNGSLLGRQLAIASTNLLVSAGRASFEVGVLWLIFAWIFGFISGLVLAGDLGAILP